MRNSRRTLGWFTVGALWGALWVVGCGAEENSSEGASGNGGAAGGGASAGSGGGAVGGSAGDGGAGAGGGAGGSGAGAGGTSPKEDCTKYSFLSLIHI